MLQNMLCCNFKKLNWNFVAGVMLDVNLELAYNYLCSKGTKILCFTSTTDRFLTEISNF
jgi:hypothetical protein